MLTRVGLLVSGFLVGAAGLSAPPPSLVSLHAAYPSGQEGLCSGVLIDDDVVLTTAECAVRDLRFAVTLSKYTSYAPQPASNCSTWCASPRCASTSATSTRGGSCRTMTRGACTTTPFPAPQRYHTVDLASHPRDDDVVAQSRMGYDVAVVILERSPACFGAPHGPAAMKLPWKGDPLPSARCRHPSPTARSTPTSAPTRITPTTPPTPAPRTSPW